MRAVNLIPADARTGGGPTLGRSGGAVYALLGGLLVLVALAAVWATTSGRIADQKTELAQVRGEVAQLQARAGALALPGAVQQERASRTEMVRTLAAQRIDWAARLDALSRTLPEDVTLSALDAKGAGGSAGAAAATPATAAGPTVNLSGCAPSQRAVARLMPRLRSIPEVVGVTLLNSATGGADSGTQSTQTDACDGARFTMDIVYEGAAPAPAAAAAAPAPQAATPQSTATTAVEGTPDPGTGATQ